MPALKMCAVKILCHPPKTRFACCPRHRAPRAEPSCPLSSAPWILRPTGEEKLPSGPGILEGDKSPSKQTPPTRSCLASRLRPDSVRPQARSSETRPMHSFDNECPSFVQPNTRIGVRLELLRFFWKIVFPSVARVRHSRNVHKWP